MTGDSRIIKLMGLGMATAVLDAFAIRMLVGIIVMFAQELTTG